MLKDKMKTILILIITSLAVHNSYSEPAQKKIKHAYRQATCTDHIPRYCVKAKTTNRLWWIALYSTLPPGVTDPGDENCDKATVGTNLKGAFTVIPDVKCNF